MKIDNLYYYLSIIIIIMFSINCNPYNSKTRINEERFEKQLRNLYKLDCRLRKTKVPTRSLFDSTSPISDMKLVYPEYVVIKKCFKSCSYCKFQQDVFGIENRVCEATLTGKKSFVVKYLTEDNTLKLTHVKTQVDKRCECIDKEHTTS